MSEQPWSIADLPRLDGQVAVVTGANSGIGLETARELLRAGAQVVLACRDAARAGQARDELVAALGQVPVSVIPLNLASLASVAEFAAQFAQQFGQLDLLINNAGVMMLPLEQTIDGFEVQLGTNHFGHFALTGLLLPHLLAAPAARVVTVSSMAHHSGAFELGNLLYDQGGYTPFGAYARSKLANVLFAAELQRRLTQAGVGARSFAAHPGIVGTGLGDHLLHPVVLSMVKPLMYLAFASPAKGARPSLRAATDARLNGGEYLGPSWLGGWYGPPEVVQPSPAARSVPDAAALWERSAQLTGIKFNGL